MAETYCGKSCGDCVHKEKLNCPGCKTGPGARIKGDCGLAKCCISKGHTACESCNIKPRCGMFHGREQAPVHRIKAIETEAKRLEEIRVRTTGLHKVFYLLFWLVVPAEVGSVLSNELLAKPYPVLGTVGIFISFLVSIIYGIVLLSQYQRQKKYLTAGVLFVVASVLGIVSEINAPPEGKLTFMTLVGLAAGVIQLIAVYNEFHAHSEVLIGIGDLADKWHRLWYWYIGIYGALLGGILIMVISLLLGLLVMFVGAIGMIVVGICKLVYLHRSAKRIQFFHDKLELTNRNN